MVYLRRSFRIPQGIIPGSDEEYRFTLRDRLAKVRCPQGGFFLAEYKIQRKLKPESARILRRPFSKPLRLHAEKDTKGRWNLRVNFADTVAAKSRRFYYHKLLAMLLLQTKYSRKGRRLPRRVSVQPKDWKFYQVHHKNWNNLDCRLKNLEPVEQGVHEGAGRDGWDHKSLTHPEKVGLVRAACRVPGAMRLRG